MKSKIFAVAFLAVVAYACSPKVAVGTTKPDVVQVPPKVASPNEASNPTEEKYAAGKILYDNRCGTCHKLFAPTDYSKEDWGPILVRMQIKARIDDADMAQINNYIYSHL